MTGVHIRCFHIMQGFTLSEQAVQYTAQEQAWKLDSKEEPKADQLTKIDLYCMTNNSNEMGNIFVYLFLLSDRNKSLGSCQHFAETTSTYKCWLWVINKKYNELRDAYYRK
jgi:mevalonate pyrophosphate decarboxylase